MLAALWDCACWAFMWCQNFKKCSRLWKPEVVRVEVLLVLEYERRDNHAKRFRVYLFSRKLWFMQDAVEKVLWISLWRWNSKCLDLGFVDWYISSYSHDTIRLLSKLLSYREHVCTHCLIFFQVFGSHFDVHLSIMSPRQYCGSSWASCKINWLSWCRHYYPSVPECVSISVSTSLDEQVAKEQFPPAKMFLILGPSLLPGIKRTE